MIRPSVVFLLLLCGYSAWQLASWPVMRLDTDLWYHLTGGRFILEHRMLPQGSFFSFIDPPRAWIDYYWLFQVIVYSLYTWWGYYGLIGLRALLYVGLCGALIWYLVSGQRMRHGLTWSACLGMCCSALFLERGELIRPHLFTYLFLVVFIAVYELCPSRVLWLLPVAVLWVNVHGIAYPLLVFISAAYTLEQLVEYVRRTPRSRRFPWLALASCGLLAASVLCTPHGWRLLTVPFARIDSFPGYVNEMAKLAFHDIASFEVRMLMPPTATLFNFLLVAGAFAGLAAMSRRTLRLSHALLAIGGAFLLTKGVRFRYECVLLMLPLLKTQLPFAPNNFVQQLSKPLYFAYASLLLIPLFVLTMMRYQYRPRYPAALETLPEGVATFLQTLEAEGRVLNHPNHGGYLEWRLYPRYRIFTDMQGMLFTDEDMRVSMTAFQHEDTLRTVLARYEPSFISVQLEETAFPKVIEAFEDYALVFFDDIEALYANRRHYPAIVDRYALKHLDPFTLMQMNEEELFGQDTETSPSLEGPKARMRRLFHSKDRVSLRDELERQVVVYPDGVLTHRLLGLLHKDQKQYEQTLGHAEHLIRIVPASALGYRLKADALRGLARYDEAIAAYRLAFVRMPLDQRAQIATDLGLAYLGAGDAREAFKHLDASLDLYAATTNEEALYNLAVAARLSGRRDKAKDVLEHLSTYRRRSDDRQWLRRLEEERLRLESPQTSQTSGVEQ